MNTKPRRNAYEIVKAEKLESAWSDRKGEWTINGLYREREYQGEFRYETRITFNPNPNAGIKKVDQSKGYVYYYGSMDLDRWKKQVKSKIGYIPNMKILKKMLDFLDKRREGHEEEDQYYALQDKQTAVGWIEECFNRAMEWYRAGEETDKLYTNQWRRSNYERFVRKEDKTLLDEAFKVINGHAYIEPENGIHGGHTHAFRRRLDLAIHNEEKYIDLQNKRKRREHLCGLLDTDPMFRRLVAHTIAADKTKRGYGSSSLSRELSYRLFGYAKNLSELRMVMSRLSDLLKPYQLETYDARLLLDIGKQYLLSGGMLPVVQPEFTRNNGFYYGDAVKKGGLTFEANRIGLLYIYLSNGSRIKIDQIEIA